MRWDVLGTDRAGPVFVGSMGSRRHDACVDIYLFAWMEIDEKSPVVSTCRQWQVGQHETCIERAEGYPRNPRIMHLIEWLQKSSRFCQIGIQ